MYLPFAGIGSRDLPQEKYNLLYSTCASLATYGFTLRSGGANGSDTACEKGCGSQYGKKEIFYAHSATGDAGADKLVELFHPAPDKLVGYTRLLMARNGYQVLGKNLDSKSLFVLCYTNDGAPFSTDWRQSTRFSTGGTGQAIRLAIASHIPVFNIHNNATEELAQFLHAQSYWETCVKIRSGEIR